MNNMLFLTFRAYSREDINFSVCFFLAFYNFFGENTAAFIMSVITGTSWRYNCSCSSSSEVVSQSKEGTKVSCALYSAGIALLMDLGQLY